MVAKHYYEFFNNISTMSILLLDRKEPLHSPSPEPPKGAPAEDVVQGEDTAPENTPQTTTPDTPPTTPQDTTQDAVEGAAQDAVGGTAQDTPQDAAQETPQPEQTEDCAAKVSEQEESEKKKEWCQDELMKISRKFNLDLAPKVSIHPWLGNLFFNDGTLKTKFTPFLPLNVNIIYFPYIISKNSPI